MRAPAAARALSSPGSFIACRISNRWRRRAARDAHCAMEGLALTGAWVDRERGLVSMIVLEMGGSSDLCAALHARRAGRADGPDRDADRYCRWAKRSCWSAAGSATPCCSRSVARSGRPARGCCISPATGASPIATRSRRSKPPPMSSSGAATKGRDSPRRGAGHAFVGNIVEAMRAYASGRSVTAPIPLGDATASSRSARTG